MLLIFASLQTSQLQIVFPDKVQLCMSLAGASNYQRNIVLDSDSKPLDLPSSIQNLSEDLIITEGSRDALDEASKDHTFETPKEDLTGFPPEAPIEAPKEISMDVDAVSNSNERKG